MTLLDLTPRATTSDRLATLPVVIIGAGPIGLAAAANLVERGIDFTILEAGEGIASSILLWGHTRLFSPWKHLIDPSSRRLLEAAGWSAPTDEDRAPTGHELITGYLQHLAALLAGDWQAAERTPDHAAADASRLVTSYVHWHLERRVRSLTVLERT